MRGRVDDDQLIRSGGGDHRPQHQYENNYWEMCQLVNCELKIEIAPGEMVVIEEIELTTPKSRSRYYLWLKSKTGATVKY